MNSTEPTLSVRLAGELFDRVLIPMASARRTCVAPDHPQAGLGNGGASYLSPVSVSVMAAADFEFPGRGSADGLIEALAAFWEGSAEPELLVLTSMMRETAAALREEVVANDGTVSVFCYAMF